jgi:hypothetical protein
MLSRSEQTKYAVLGIGVILASLVLAGNFSFSHHASANTPPSSTVKSQDISLSFGNSSSGLNTASQSSLQLPSENARYISQYDFLTPTTKTDFSFNGMALSWEANMPEGTNIVFSLQTIKNGSVSGLRQIPEDADMQGSDTPKHFSVLDFNTDNPDSFVIKATLSTNNPNVTPQISNIQAHYLDSTQGPSLNFIKQTNSLHTQTTSAPTVITRAQWGANEGLMTWPPQYSAPKKFIVHHTAGTQGGSDPASVMRGIYQYHAVTRGWGDIGYNYVVDEKGDIFEGRYGGNGVIGAHAVRTSGGTSVSYNVGSIGISVMGNYDEDAFTAASENAISSLIGSKAILNNIDPTASSYFVDRTMPNIVGHRDVDFTACPGANLYADLATIRTKAKDYYLTGPTIPDAYKAEIVSVPNPVIVEDHNYQYVTVKIKNTGSATWSNSSSNFIALNATDPIGRTSNFQDSSWLASFRPTKMKEATVPSGGIATFQFTIRDNVGNEGLFNENFQLVSEHVTWIDGSKFTLPIKVVPRYKAQIDELPTTDELTFNPGQTKTIAIWMKNVGTRTWTNTGANFAALNLQNPSGRSSVFQDPSWVATFRPTLLDSPGTLNPGQWGYFQFNLHAPTTAGTYKEDFQAVLEHVTWINGSYFSLNINVTPPYRGEVISVSVNPNIEVDQTQKVSVRMKNVGTATWSNSGDNFIALNVNDPPGKNSLLRDPATWTEYSFRPGRMSTPSVTPGQIGDFEFTIKAPSTKGTYTESFQAVAEHVTWVAGTSFTIKVDAVNPYEGQIVEKSAETVAMEDAATKNVWVKIKNIGSRTWQGGKDSLNTYPASRDSIFQGVDWVPYYFTADVLSQNVAPGQTATFSFNLSSPANTKGNFTESFMGTVAGGTPIIGTQVNYYVQVTPRYDGVVTFQTAPDLTLKPLERYLYNVDVRNTGTRTWTNTGDNFVAMNAINPIGRTSAFKDPTWPEVFRPTKLTSPASVAPGQTGRFSFWLQAPNTTADYDEQFKLVAEHVMWMPSSLIDINIHVKTLRPESTIKVGIKDLPQIQVTGNGSFKAVRGGDGFVLGNFTSGQVATVTVEGGNSYYRVAGPGVNATTSDYVRFIPNGSTILKISNYHDIPSWDTSLDDNQFRGNILAWRSGATGKFWAINELPVESYLKGIAEQSNTTNATHLRTMAIAERTYAQYNIDHSTKHTNEHYDLNNTSGDQVYKGYGFEIRSPNVAAAVNDTKGKMITYGGQVIVAPYFSRSDGRTRSWTEVWGGSTSDHPYAISVDDHWSEPSSACSGHCVGLSAYGANTQALEGKTYEQILKYYFTGVAITDYY